jgi:hypothetical protein
MCEALEAGVGEDLIGRAIDAHHGKSRLSDFGTRIKLNAGSDRARLSNKVSIGRPARAGHRYSVGKVHDVALIWTRLLVDLAL